MTPRIGHLPPGEELIDVESFVALHSSHLAAPALPSIRRGGAPPPMRDLDEIDPAPPHPPSHPVRHPRPCR